MCIRDRLYSLAMGQIPRSTERISSYTYDVITLCTESNVSSLNCDISVAERRILALKLSVCDFDRSAVARAVGSTAGARRRVCSFPRSRWRHVQRLRALRNHTNELSLLDAAYLTTPRLHSNRPSPSVIRNFAHAHALKY